MSYQELLQLIISQGYKIDTLWQIFITVHLAVFAFVFIYSQKFEETPFGWKALSYLGYLIFIGMNFNALVNSYEFLNALHLQFASIKNTENLSTQLVSILKNTNFNNRFYLLCGIHGFATIAIAAAIFRRKNPNSADDYQLVTLKINKSLEVDQS